MDLTKIPEFHPRVFQVDLIDGRTFREAGVSYQCHLSGRHRNRPAGENRHSIAQDTLGVSKVLSDHTVETTFQKLGDSSTNVEINHYYSTPTLKAKLLNLVAKGEIARETHPP